MVKDWTPIYERYKGLWVALAEDEETVLAAGKNAQEVFDEAQRKGYSTPILTHMQSKLIAYVGYCS